MTILSDVAKIRQELDRVEEQVDGLVRTVATHDEQISGQRGLTSLVNELQSLTVQVEALQRAFGEFSAISKALAEKGGATRTFLVAMLAVLVPIIIYFIAHGAH